MRICSGTSAETTYVRRVSEQTAQQSQVAVITDIDALAGAVAAQLAAQGLAGLEPEPYWTAERAAAYIGADKQRIYDLSSQGRLRCVKDGGRLLSKRSWIDHYLEGRE